MKSEIQAWLENYKQYISMMQNLTKLAETAQQEKEKTEQRNKNLKDVPGFPSGGVPDESTIVNFDSKVLSKFRREQHFLDSFELAGLTLERVVELLNEDEDENQN